jgi:hypothetical protein
MRFLVVYIRSIRFISNQEYIILTKDLSGSLIILIRNVLMCNSICYKYYFEYIKVPYSAKVSGANFWTLLEPALDAKI